MFVGESAALDFLNSVAAPKTMLIDWLETGPDLLDWLVQAGLCTDAELAHLRDVSHEADMVQALHEIHEFRDELRRFVKTVAGRTQVAPTNPMIEKINQLLARGRQQLKIIVAPQRSKDASRARGALTLSTIHEILSPYDLLPRIAAACARFICEADFRHVRNCEGPTCTLFFLDVSKSHKRRWCAMEVCGNRAKAAAHRAAKSRTRRQPKKN